MTPLRVNRRWIVLLGALAVAAWLAVFGDKRPNGEVVQAAAANRPAAPTGPALLARSGAVASVSKTERIQSSQPSASDLEAPLPRDWLIVDGAQHGGNGNLFAAGSWTPPPPPPPPPQPAPPPAAPAVPYTVIGKKLESDQWEVYLTHGQMNLIAKVGDVLEGAYRVDAIQPPQMSLTYLPLKQAQNLDIGGTR
jgi:hypothetical protein